MSDTHARSTGPVTIFDVDQLMSGATPQFSQQIRERLLALVEPLPADDEVRRYAEKHVAVLEHMATATTRGIRKLGAPDDSSDAWSTIPSHPAGGIAPGVEDATH